MTARFRQAAETALFEGLDKFDLQLVVRAAAAAFLGLLVGWERGQRGSSAGSRTYALVALGAAAFTTVALDRFQVSAGQILGGIVTGVGFLGAGLIIHEPQGVIRGLTGAAALWAVAAIGMVVGAGDLVIGVLLTLLILIVLGLKRLPILSQLARRRHHGRGDQEEASTLPEVPTG